MKIRLLFQTLSLGLFLYLLFSTAFPLVTSIIPLDFFLRIDPLIATQIPLLTKIFIPKLFLAFGLLLLTLIFGRIFCGYICPMGITLDIARKILPSFNTNKANKVNNINPSFRAIKYLILFAITITSLLNVSYIFWGSPLSLITRFYSLIIHPLLMLLGNHGLSEFRPFFAEQNMLDLAYMQIMPRFFQTVYFVAFFFISLFILEKISPRFWCKFLCPAGAILALLSFRPFWKRNVNGCISCGKCVKNCPTSAIYENGIQTQHSECITCHKCVDICPSKAISFSFINNKKKNFDKNKSLALPSRRAFINASLAGMSLSAISALDSNTFFSSATRSPSSQSGLIRPPASRPEKDFLELCIRCGACMKVCPTNGLQPTWLIAGFNGIFSPMLQSRIGACEPECNACGQVCPTNAIMALSLEDKEQAKIGTAVVKQSTCLAWSQNKTCVVCQEVCPYGAIEIKTYEYGKVAAPIVAADKCYGCGFCERHCPVRIPAIIIEPLNALRLNTNTYKESAKTAGLDILPTSKRALQYNQYPTMQNSTHQIFGDDELPPGFVE